jgi:hypothetical protein
MHHGSSNIDDTNFGHDSGLAGDEGERIESIVRMKRSISQRWRVRAMRRAMGSRGRSSGVLVPSQVSIWLRGLGWMFVVRLVVTCGDDVPYPALDLDRQLPLNETKC